jgi:transposase-like protein
VGDRRKRRRSWPVAEKRRIVAETLVPGASVSVVARRHDVNANQVLKWRRELAAGDRAGLPVTACEFVPIGVFDAVEREAPAAAHDDGRRPDATNHAGGSQPQALLGSASLGTRLLGDVERQRHGRGLGSPRARRGREPRFGW